jgi:predicted ATP-dependent serine protease
VVIFLKQRKKGIFMECPHCGAWSTVKETRSSPTRYRRRRECANEHSFTTEEVVVSQEKIRAENTERLRVIRTKRVESKK